MPPGDLPPRDRPPLDEAALSEVFLAGTGPGGQNVNKVATAVQLHLDVYALRLPVSVFERLRRLAGSRWTIDGQIVVTARRHRTREANREDARARLTKLIEQAHDLPDRRIETRPSRAAKTRRLDGKAIRGDVKRARSKVHID